MPRPVLSETTFNSDDIATSILQQANLQITNENLGHVDITSNFTVVRSTASIDNFIAVSFNGLVFISGQYSDTSGPSHGTVIVNTSDSGYRTNAQTIVPTIGYQGDSAMYIQIQTDGDWKIIFPSNAGVAHYYNPFNAVYKCSS